MKEFLSLLAGLLKGLFKALNESKTTSPEASPKSTAEPLSNSSPSEIPKPPAPVEPTATAGAVEPGETEAPVSAPVVDSSLEVSEPESTQPAQPAPTVRNIGLQIVAFEASPGDPTRRTKDGFLDVVGLPANDGGGSWEIAGINEFHAEARAKLRAMPPKDREAFAADYIENYGRKGTGITKALGLRTGTELFVLDCAFNRGPGGACEIVQDALVHIGFSMDAMGGKGWGPRTRDALLVADKRHASSLIGELRLARERYEDARDAKKGARPNLRTGLVNRWNKCAEIAREWNADAVVAVPAPAPRPVIVIGEPGKIVLPRESDSALNKFYGTATPQGNFLEWFNFPCDNVRLYSRTGPELTDRDGDGNDEHRAHKLIVKRLEAAFREAYETLGKIEFERQGLHVYAGAFNYRKKTGGGSLSTHSWGIAVDINPDPNGWHHYATTFNDVTFDIFEKHGFLSAFRAWGHDAMHFQAAIPTIASGSYYAKRGLPKHIVAAS